MSYCDIKSLRSLRNLWGERKPAGLTLRSGQSARLHFFFLKHFHQPHFHKTSRALPDQPVWSHHLPVCLTVKVLLWHYILKAITHILFLFDKHMTFVKQNPFTVLFTVKMVIILVNILKQVLVSIEMLIRWGFFFMAVSLIIPASRNRLKRF